MSTPAKQIEKLRETLRGHDYAYYTLAKPTVSDQEYDRLMRELIELEKHHPELQSPDSPSQRLGGEVVNKFKSVVHRVRMMSIDNTYNEADFRAFDARVCKTLGVDKVDYVVEPKIDGVACSLRYEHGKLVSGATRGDGTRGDDVTHNVKTVSEIPLTLHRAKGAPAIPEVIEVRGEMFTTNAAFQKINADQIAKGEEPYANPRNFTAGTLKQQDSAVARKRNMRFVTHGVGEIVGLEIDSYHELIGVLRKFGIPIAPHTKRVQGGDAAWREIQSFKQIRGTLEFATDGMVVKVDSREQREILGVGTKSPKWVIAFKYPAEQVQTTLLDVRWQVGKNGTLTPVADMAPVFVAGTTVQHATLHNIERIEHLDLHIGDTVVIEKAGEVIPQVVRAIEAKRPRGAKGVKAPKKCPSCGAPVEKDPDTPYIRCENPACPAQLKQRLEWFAGRRQMDIEGLGEKIIEQLVDQGFVKSISDLYSLTVEQIANLTSETTVDGEVKKRRVGEKTAQTIVEALEQSKAAGLDRVLAGLGVRHLGASTAVELARYFGDVDSLMKASLDEFQRALSDATDLEKREAKARDLAQAIRSAFRKKGEPNLFGAAAAAKNGDEIAAQIEAAVASAGVKMPTARAETLADAFASLEALAEADEETIYRALRDDLVVASSLHTFFHSALAKDLFAGLKKAGLKMTAERATRGAANGPLKGKSIVVTGTLPHVDRPTMERLIAEMGGKASGSVSKKTAFVVAGESAGSKLDKANELGIEVINEEEFFKRIGRPVPLG